VAVEAEATATKMKLRYDAQVDAASVEVRGPISPGSVDATEPLDEDRLVHYDSNDEIIEYEFLNVKRYGVRLDDLEHREELAALFREAGFQERDWSTPWGSGWVIRRRDRATG
jgi:uncharacterized protein YuzE